MAKLSKTESIEFMLKQFKIERYVYLSVTIVSFILLLICVGSFMLRNGGEPIDTAKLSYVAGMLGSGGAIAFTSSQLLRMWRDCMNLLTNTKITEEDGNE